MDKLIITSYNDFSVLAHRVYGKENTNSINIYDNTIKDNDIILKNPAFILKHPSRPLIYVCYESIYDGSIATLDYSNDEFKILNVVSSEGKSSCYLEFTPNMENIININYWDSSITIHPIKDGILQSASKIYRNKSENNIVHIEDHLKNRQTTSHHHSCVFYKEKLFVPDLGTDKIDIFKYQNNELLYEKCINLKKGSGPRYSKIVNDIMYIVNELNSTVVVLDLLDNFKILQTISTIPDNCQKNTCSGIQIVEDFLFVSNRGDDSIAVYKILKNCKLELINIFKTSGKTPRHFRVNLDMTKIYVANQDSNDIAIFNIKNGNLEFVNKFEYDSPNYILII